MKKLVLIPARGGSKGLPNKNIKLLNGKPTISYTIEAALENFDKQDIIVSTDSVQILEVAKKHGLEAPFLRPDYLASDTASTQDVIFHALDYIKKNKGIVPDVVILLQVTSPLRNGKHINEALKLYSPKIDMVVSVKKTESNPYYTLFEENSNGYLTPSKTSSFKRRQDCPNVWELNGAIYIINPNSLINNSIRNFTKIVKYPMDKTSSIDIDDQVDFNTAELIMKNNEV